MLSANSEVKQDPTLATMMSLTRRSVSSYCSLPQPARASGRPPTPCNWIGRRVDRSTPKNGEFLPTDLPTENSSYSPFQRRRPRHFFRFAS